MYNKKSDYALNKKESDLLYSDAYGNRIRLTADDFESVEDFQHWKTWITEESHKEEKAEHLHRNHTSNAAAISKPYGSTSMEDADCPQQQTLMDSQIRHKLTATQYRRLWLYYVGRRSVAEIADMEGTSQRVIYKSLAAAKKKCKLFVK